MLFSHETRLRTLGIILLILGVAATASADTVRVIVDRALIWSRPAGVSVILTQVSKDTRLEVVGRVGDWYEVVIPDVSAGPGQTGFLRVAQVVLVASGQQTRQAAGPARIRQGGFVNLDGVHRSNTHVFVRTGPAFGDRYAQAGSITANYGGSTGEGLGILMGAAIWGPIGVGVGAEYFSRRQAATVDAQVPHPVLSNQRRAASFVTEPLHSYETAIHIPAVWIAASGPFRAMVYGGVSIFRLSQVVVTDLVLDDPSPYDSVRATGVTTEGRRGVVAGAHAGADVAYFFTPNLGVGVGGRYSRGKIKFQDDAGVTSDGIAGTAEVLGGIRIRF